MPKHTQRAVLTNEQEFSLRQYMPSFHVCLLGPVPFGQLERVHLSVSHIILPTAEEAELAVRLHASELCVLWAREWVEEEWDLLHVVASNTCN